MPRFRSGRALFRGIGCAFFFVMVVAVTAGAAEKGEGKARGDSAKKAKATQTPGSTIPLPVGQEVKGLVLPDFDTQGRLRARFEAASAKRIDDERVQFTGLKVVSYTPENTMDFRMDVPESTLNLTTRVISSDRRTTIERADFTIAGDAMQFDTRERKGTLTGNVRMVITDLSSLEGEKKKK